MGAQVAYIIYFAPCGGRGGAPRTNMKGGGTPLSPPGVSKGLANGPAWPAPFLHLRKREK